LPKSGAPSTSRPPLFLLQLFGLRRPFGLPLAFFDLYALSASGYSSLSEGSQRARALPGFIRGTD
jgi:hypothetical protein